MNTLPIVQCTERQLDDIITHVEGVVENKIGSFLWKIVAGFILAVITFAVGWGMLQQKVENNTKVISALQNTSSIYLTRQQVEDLLGGRDQRLTAIESTASRIEAKVDRILLK